MSEIDEAAILAWLEKSPGEWHVHYMPEPVTEERLSRYGGRVREEMRVLLDPDNPRYLRNALPDRGVTISDAELHAVLSSMLERGLIEGCDCGCRGDWHVLTATERKLEQVLSQLPGDFIITNTETHYDLAVVHSEKLDLQLERITPFPKDEA